MPTYEYACRDCGEHLEVVQSFKDAPLTECGRCGGTLRKVFSAAGIIFKGSGYYVTDSRKGGSGSSESKESNESKESKESTGSSTTESKSSSDESKPASKSSDSDAKSA